MNSLEGMQRLSQHQMLLAVFVAALLGVFLALGTAKVWYYVKVIRTTERILKSQKVEFEF